MNLIPKIAEMLGVEIEEEFVANDKTVKFTDKALVFHGCDDRWCNAECTLYGLIVGIYEVKKLPFAPKKGEAYFRVIVFSSKLEISEDVWGDAIRDYEAKYCGNCFRTEVEAEKHKYEIYEKLTGKKWEEK